MSNGKSWATGYRPNRYMVDGHHACPNGRAKCWACSRPDLVDYRDSRRGPLSDSLSDLLDD